MSQFTLTPPDWMTSAAVGPVLAALTAGGEEARFVGGCVRDAILGRAVNDIDIATPLEPATIIARAEAAKIKAIPTGIDHGTVTLVCRGQPFEVTTLREDVETDGRHAVVAFTDDWQADAARRDFTFNAMSCTADGRLFDYFEGRADLDTGRVRFVGDPALRLEEDVLRLLRFYRMHAWFGQGAPEEAGRAACRAAADRLPRLSAERVREELLKTFRAPDPAPVLRLMADDGVLPRVLPEAMDLDRLATLVAETEAPMMAALAETAELAEAPDAALRRLAATFDPQADIAALPSRLKLSNAQARHLKAVHDAAGALDLRADRAGIRRQIYDLGIEVFADAVAVSAAAGPNSASAVGPAADALAGWDVTGLPVRGADLTDRGVPPGPLVGVRMRALEAWWVAHDFVPDRAALLVEIDRRGAAGWPDDDEEGRGGNA